MNNRSGRAVATLEVKYMFEHLQVIGSERCNARGFRDRGCKVFVFRACVRVQGFGFRDLSAG